jgi:hypothetical protein
VGKSGVSFRLTVGHAVSEVRLPVNIGGKKLYRISEALAEAHLSRATYFRWLRSGRITDTQYKDRNKRRLFTPKEVLQLRAVSQQLITSSSESGGASE